MAEIKTQEVEYRHGDVALKGYLAWDDAATGKRPGVLVAPEWWGMNEYVKSRARQLAELGYVAFVCDMYGDGRVTEKAEEANRLAEPFYMDRPLFRARVGAGFKVLSERPQVDASKLGAIGYCFGGTTVLELARSGADVKVVVSFHGGLSNPHPEDAARIKAKVLVCNGAADTFIKPEERAQFVKDMEEAKVDYVFVDYAGAVHSFTNPGADKYGIPGVKYDEKADKRSWRHMRGALEEAFGAAGGRDGQGAK